MATIVKNLPLCTHRYVLFVSYLGSKYNGSQRQVKRETQGVQNTVQEALEWSLETCFEEKRCRATSSSRTDKGVHALMNCFTLPLMDFSTPTEKVMRMANKRLADKHHEIVINDVILADAEFHPRKEARSREYIYKIAVINSSNSRNLSKDVRSVRMLHLVPITELYKVLPVPYFDLDKASDALDLFRGRHNFASFSPMIHADTVRNLEISLAETDPSKGSIPEFSLFQIHLKAKSFLYNQVRRMIGSVLSYATHGRIELDHIKYLIDNPSPSNWTSKTIVAEPWGLYLSCINYDRSVFENAIRTFSNGRTEKVLDVIPSTNESDDNIQTEQKLIASS